MAHEPRDIAAIQQAVIEQARDNIARRGWTVVGVFPVPGEPSVPFSYTAGLSEKQLPELAIYGLDARTAGTLLNAAAQRMIDNAKVFESGERIDGLLAGGLPLSAVAMIQTTDMNMVRTLYGTVATAVQIVWPDTEGKMPWNTGYALPKEVQPLLGLPPT